MPSLTSLTEDQVWRLQKPKEAVVEAPVVETVLSYTGSTGTF